MAKVVCKPQKSGFTLIELMIVVVVIGILAALAILQFNAYLRRGYNAAAIAALRELATAEATYYADYRTYASDINQLYAAKTGFRLERKVSILSLTIALTSSGDYTFRAVAKHDSSPDTFAYDIEQGGLQAP